MKFTMSLSVVALVLGVGSSQGDEVPPIPQDKAAFHLFLLAGQSNMAGRGTVEEQDRVPHDRVLSLNKQGVWVVAIDPLHFDKPDLVGVGLGKTFAIDYAKANPEVTVGLIPCAVGGSPISTWEPGGFHHQTSQHPYDETMIRCRFAMKSGTLKGILWHQGESDAGPELAPLYEQKLHELIQRFRSDLEMPDVPFIAGQLGQFEKRPWTQYTRQVDQTHRSLPEKVSHTAFVRSDGLTHRGDNVHFNAASFRELGHRFYRAFQSLTGASEKP